ncbi:MAG: hypothetical protein HAW67_01880 [Endozoicomonadaceae bacterium]|nr:hypothetical protein [Endozoicomonadaceae bacterium]
MRIINFVVSLALLSMVHIFWPEAMHAYGNEFSCPYGKQGACLDYGDKCVGNDTVCFDSYTCGYGGFVCKSQLNDLASEYDDLLRKCNNIASEHDNLVDEYNNLLRKYNNIASEHDDLVDKYNNLLRKYKSKASEYENLESCVSYASTLDEVKNCY